MNLFYKVEVIDGPTGNRHCKNVGLPKLTLDIARDVARGASITYGNAAVYGVTDGHIRAVFEGGNELPRERW